MSASLSTVPRRRVYTYQDYLALPDDGRRYEIIKGEIYMSPAPNLEHQRVSGNLFGTIWTYLQTHPVGEVYSAPADVILSDIDVLQPDLIFISKENFDCLTRAHVQGAPDLVVEVLSPGTEKRDRTLKLQKYSEFGAQEYWMANEEKATVEIWRRQGGKLAFHALLDRTQILTTPLLPGLEISLEKIFK